MKIALVDINDFSRTYINKEMNGGLGKKIALGSSALSKLATFAAKRMFDTPCISLAYIAAVCHQQGIETEYFQSDQIPAKFNIVLFQSSIVSYKTDLGVAKRIRARMPKAKIGFTGAFPTFMPELFLRDTNFVIVGEPEDAMHQICGGLDPEGIIRSNPVANLDDLPFAKWDIILKKRYLRNRRANLRGLPIYSSRGCSFGCSYCPYLSFFGRTRRRQTEKVLAEIELNNRKFGVRRFLFRDPNFTENKSAVRKMIDGMLSRNLNVEWSCETRLDLVDKDLLKEMRKAGLVEIGTGIEGADGSICEQMNRKSIDKDYLKEIINFAQNIGVLIQANYIIGAPGDTEESIKSTLTYAKSLNTALANFSIFTPYPGTKLWNVFKEKIIENDWEKFDLAHLVFKHPEFSKERLRSIYKKAFISYYFRPSWIGRNAKLLLASIFS